MFKFYKVTVHVEDNDGEEFKYSTTRSFIDKSLIKAWVDGFESGAAIAHDGAVLSTDIEFIGESPNYTKLKKDK